MKRKIICILIFVLGLSVLLLCACDSETHYNGIPVVYELEDGTYKTGVKVVQYYTFPEGVPHLIKKLNSDDWASTNDFIKQNYNFVGWFKTKNADGTYSDEWNFDTDLVPDEGITLYAKWEVSIVYSYEFYDYDSGELVGSKILSAKNVALRDDYVPNKIDADDATRTYTMVEYYEYDESTKTYTVWNDNSPRPKNPVTDPEDKNYNPTANTVKVYVKYIEGSWSVVKTAKQLRTAMSQNTNIYLCNDIDVAGELGTASSSLCFDGYSVDDGTGTTREFCGNGFTISNFTVGYDSSKAAIDNSVDPEDDTKNSLLISLFVNPKNLYIHDVTFENMTVDINTDYKDIYKIYVAPFAVSASGINAQNVKVSGEVKITKLPDSIKADNTLLDIETSAAFFEAYSQNCTTDDKSSFSLTTAESAAE